MRFRFDGRRYVLADGRRLGFHKEALREVALRVTTDERRIADDPVGHTGPDLYGAGGHGLFVGVMGAGLSHLYQGAALPILAAAYLVGMSRLRGWKELAALLTMMSTVVLYFVAYDLVVALSPGAWGIAAVVVGTVVVAFSAAMAVSAFVSLAITLAHAVPSRGPFGKRRSGPLPAEDVDRWRPATSPGCAPSTDTGDEWS